MPILLIVLATAVMPTMITDVFFLSPSNGNFLFKHSHRYSKIVLQKCWIIGYSLTQRLKVPLSYWKSYKLSLSGFNNMCVLFLYWVNWG